MNQSKYHKSHFDVLSMEDKKIPMKSLKLLFSCVLTTTLFFDITCMKKENWTFSKTYIANFINISLSLLPWGHSTV